MQKGVAHEVEVGETILVGDVAVAVEQKSGRKVRLRIVAPGEMQISHQRNETGESRMVAESSA